MGTLAKAFAIFARIVLEGGGYKYLRQELMGKVSLRKKRLKTRNLSTIVT